MSFLGYAAVLLCWMHCAAQREIICEKPNIMNGYVPSPRPSYKENDRMQFSCNEGYKYGSRSDALCTGSGWNPFPSCTEIECSPPVISSGNFSPQKDKYKVRDRIAVECDDGYRLKVQTGSTTAECTRDGWVPEPACVKKLCDYPRIEKGESRPPYWRYYPSISGQTLDYRCLDGYSTPTGKPWVRITCTERGWSPEPKCLKQCSVRELNYGNIRHRGSEEFYKEGERVRYECHNGYQAEHEAVTCTRNGWAPPPRCIREKTCQITIENGYLNSDKETFRLREEILYTCHTGFVTPEGHETGRTQCQESGWTPPPKCIKIACALPQLRNGDFSPKKDKYYSGDVVKFTCKNKYIRVGAASVQCYHFGWFPSPPVCKARVRGCGPPPEITNGSIVDGFVAQYQHGDRKQYECNGELKLVGSKEIECVDGQWSPPPSCIEDKMPCGSPSSIPNVALHQPEQTQYSHGDEVICGCKQGSDHTEEMKIKCLNGEWKPLPICADASPRCVIPEDIELVHSGQHPITRMKSGFDQVIHYRCTSADENIKKATCVSGRWTPEIACAAEEGVCPPPPQVSGAQQTTVGRNYRHGSKAAFSCLSGFQLVGTREITCTEGKWQSPPHCVEKPCLPPPAVECADTPRLEKPNLRIEREGKTIYLAGARLKYVCHSGYVLDGPTEINCTMGKWTAAPTCLEMQCGHVPKVANAQFEGRNKKLYEPGESVNYKCDSGFLIVGSPEITCRRGNWTVPPSCEDVHCGAAPEIPNARIASALQERYLPGARVHYQCESNFELMGRNYIICSNGQWSQGPVCRGEAGRCGRPPAIQDGDLLGLAKKEYQEGDTVKYQCQNLYIMKGPQTITCINGQWTNPPVCLVPCTASEEDMDRNNIKLKWKPKETKLYSKSGDTIEFDCKPGYLKDPSTPNFRVSCVKGTLEYPRCTQGRSCVLDRNTMERNNIQLEPSNPVSPSYQSGDPVNFKCKRWHQPDSHTTNSLRAQCLDGVITYPVCEHSWLG